MKLRALLSILVVLTFVFSASAEEIFVSSGGDLRQIAGNANSGDVIVLESGGIYQVDDIPNEASAIGFSDMSITIKAADGAATRPQVTLNGFDLSGVNGSFTLQGIDFISNGGTYFINFTAEFTLATSVQVLDCNVSGFSRCAIRANRAAAVCDSLVFDNCVFSGADGGYRFFHFEDKLSFTYFIFTNSTVNGFSEAFLWATSLSEKYVTIENCTFNNLVDPKDNFIQLDGDGGTCTLRNCLLTNFADCTVFNIWDAFVDSIQSCRYSNVGDTFNGWNYEDDFGEEDPDYADPDNGDFSLPADSYLNTAGVGGKPIGDPRWATMPASVEQNQSAAADFSLGQNYPNPFNPVTSIAFNLANAEHVTITVYNSLGQLVTTLVDQNYQQGVHRVTFDAHNLDSGLYFYKIQAGDFVEAKKMALVK